jgi:hypothetical protein
MKRAKTFLATHKELRSQASSLRIFSGTKTETYFDALQSDHVKSQLTEALDRHHRKDERAAWSALAEAGQAIGYLQGLMEGLRRNEPQQLLSRKLSANGKKGGTNNGANRQLLRDKVAALLITAVSTNRWATRKRIVAGYDEIAATVPGFSATDYQKRRIFARPEIKAILPPK